MTKDVGEDGRTEKGGGDGSLKFIPGRFHSLTGHHCICLHRPSKQLNFT